MTSGRSARGNTFNNQPCLLVYASLPGVGNGMDMHTHTQLSVDNTSDYGSDINIPSDYGSEIDIDEVIALTELSTSRTLSGIPAEITQIAPEAIAYTGIEFGDETSERAVEAHRLPPATVVRAVTMPATSTSMPVAPQGKWRASMEIEYDLISQQSWNSEFPALFLRLPSSSTNMLTAFSSTCRSTIFCARGRSYTKGLTR